MLSDEVDADEHIDFDGEPALCDPFELLLGEPWWKARSGDKTVSDSDSVGVLDLEPGTSLPSLLSITITEMIFTQHYNVIYAIQTIVNVVVIMIKVLISIVKNDNNAFATSCKGVIFVINNFSVLNQFTVWIINSLGTTHVFNKNKLWQFSSLLHFSHQKKCSVTNPKF